MIDVLITIVIIMTIFKLLLYLIQRINQNSNNNQNVCTNNSNNTKLIIYCKYCDTPFTSQDSNEDNLQKSLQHEDICQTCLSQLNICIWCPNLSQSNYDEQCQLRNICRDCSNKYICPENNPDCYQCRYIIPKYNIIVIGNEITDSNKLYLEKCSVIGCEFETRTSEICSKHSGHKSYEELIETLTLNFPTTIHN